MTDDDAIETVARAMRGQLIRRQPDADYSTGDFRTMAATLIQRAGHISLTPADLAGIAGGTRVVVPVEPTDEMNAAGSEYLPVTPYGNRRADAAGVYTAMLTARPGAKEGDDA